MHQALRLARNAVCGVAALRSGRGRQPHLVRQLGVRYLLRFAAKIRAMDRIEDLPQHLPNNAGASIQTYPNPPG
jgi:hypothetical protein